jgi:hypothetical protein
VIKALTCTFTGGAEGTRTPDPHTASVVRYQLRHSPVVLRAHYKTPSPAVSTSPGWSAKQRSETGVVTLQTPLPALLHQRGPAGVAQRRQPVPAGGRQLGERADEAASGPAVGDEQQGLPLRQGGQPLLHDGAGPGSHLYRGLSADGVALPGAPGVVLRRPLQDDLGAGQALPGPEVGLPQPLVGVQSKPHVLAHGRGGVAGTAQVGADHQRRWRGSKHCAEGLSLYPAELVEADIELPLDATVSVVGRPAARSRSLSTKGMTGQSFQRRSRA